MEFKFSFIEIKVFFFFVYIDKDWNIDNVGDGKLIIIILLLDLVKSVGDFWRWVKFFL